MAMVPKRKRVSEVYQFFKQREGHFVCEIKKIRVGRLVE